VKRSTGTWRTYKSRLRSAAAIEQRGDLWFTTASGRAAVGAKVIKMPEPGAELVEFWIERISGIGPMLRELARRYPRAIGREDLAGAIGISSETGTFRTYVSRLRSAGLIEANGKQLRAASALMERAA